MEDKEGRKKNDDFYEWGIMVINNVGQLNTMFKSGPFPFVFMSDDMVWCVYHCINNTFSN